MLPTFETYGNYSSSNYGANALVFTMPCGGLIYFSYKTPVAFVKDGKKIVRENNWGPTTGKHLNAIDGGNKKARVSGEAFEKALEAAF